MRSTVLPLLAVLGSLAGLGCESTMKYFRVSSFPEGATVYVDGEPRGQTNIARLGVDFETEEKRATIRIVKEGYQTTGTVLSDKSSPEIAFFLAEAPKNQEILQVLKDMLQVLDRMSAELRMLREAKEELP